jgi:hypothetical protein
MRLSLGVCIPGQPGHSADLRGSDKQVCDNPERVHEMTGLGDGYGVGLCRSLGL